MALAFLASPVEAKLPYIPTTILRSNTLAYIFAPSGSSVGLAALNTSTTLSASSLKIEPLALDLPFLTGQANVAFAPSLLDNGTLAVFAGDCSVATTASLWTLAPASGKAVASWTRHVTTPSSNWDYGQGSPYLLGGSLSFSSQLAPVISDPIIYVYGGMCPFSNTTASSVQSSATYSNRMLKISPPSSRHTSDTHAYTISYAKSGGPPIAEAGFTFTELAPSLSNRSGIVTQQTSHVLLGGHTQQAFINMSTAAIWSLPEEAWSFVSIASPSTTSKTDLLAVKDTSSVTTVTSRSGHTAVLSEDGTSLVILGGWVGSLDQAAEPQLAVIKIGTAFGDWQWSIPAAQPSGSGIYGHGATLLPGNVMMVYGGYEISGSSKSRRAASTKMFFNITSLSWSDEYTNPIPVAQQGSSSPLGSPKGGIGGGGGGGGSSSSEPGVNTDSTSNSKQVGLGIGLGLGIPLLLIAVAVTYWLYRKRVQRRARRDEALRGLAQGPGPLPMHQHGEMLERDFAWNADAARDWYTGGHDPYVQGRRSLGYETLRGGSSSSRSGASLYMPPPPMTNTGGRPRAARGLYQPSTSIGSTGGGYDFAPLRTSMKNEIHPIYEDDEEEENGDLGASGPISTRHDDDDPFATPTPTPTNPATPVTGLFPPPTSSSSDRSTSTPSPDNIKARPGQLQDTEVQEWVSDVDAADAVLTAKIGRHGSTTTTPPRFSQSTLPHHSQLQPPPAGRLSPHRRNSTRSGGVSDLDDTRTGSNLSDRSAFSFVAGAERVTTTQPQPSHDRDRQFRGGPASSNPSVPGLTPGATETRLGTSGSSSDGSFSTARSTFAALQAEGPSLLLHGGDVNSDDIDDDYIHVPGSPSKSKPRRSWLGSFRRVFSGGTPSDSSRGDSPTRESLLDANGSASGGSDYEPRLVGMGPNGTMLRRKQGREAWDSSLGGKTGDEDEWDVERAVEQRLVQVMFTVPKERLRVVNADLEKEEEAVVVDPDKEGYCDDDAEEEEHQQRAEAAAAALLHPDDADTGKGKEREANKLGLSPSASLRTASITTNTAIQMAEAIRLERPRTRVLEMVESIESRSSRENSPGGNPSR